VTSVS